MRKRYDQNCPIARTLDIIGDRWTLLLIRDLFLGKGRYSDLLRSSPGVPPRLLSERLKMLEGHGLIERAIYSEHPLRAEYRLTPRGRTLFPVLKAIGDWGLTNLFPDDPEVGRAVEQYVKSSIPEFRQEAPVPEKGT